MCLGSIHCGKEILVTIRTAVFVRAAIGDRILEEIPVAGRRRCRPLEGGRVPWIVAGDLFAELPRDEQIDDEGNLENRHGPGTHRHRDVHVDVLKHRLPEDVRAVGRLVEVGVTTIIPAAVETRHALHEHREEDDVHANQGWPEMQVIELTAHEATGDLRIPVENTTEETEQDSGSHHIVEVTDDVVGVVQVKVGQVEGQRQTR